MLRLVDPGDAKAFEALDRGCGVISHASEDDQAIARRGDAVAIDLETLRQAHRRNLAPDQPLGGLRQRLLRFADADGQRAALGFANFCQKLREEMRFPRTPAAEHGLVSAGCQQRFDLPPKKWTGLSYF